MRAVRGSTGRSDLHLPPEVLQEPLALVRARAARRVRFLAVATFVALGVLALRGAQLAIAPSNRTITEGTAQRYSQVKIRGVRGDVLDRNGVALSTSIAMPNVVADPLAIADEEVDGIAARLAEHLGVPAAELAERLRSERRYVRLAMRVHPEVANRVRPMFNPRQVWVEHEQRRYYPEKSLGSQVLGYVDNDNVGMAGLERALDDELRGGERVVQRKRDQRGQDLSRPAALDLALHDGHSVYTTIDRHIQHVVEKALVDAAALSNPEAVSAVVVHVPTGDVLAMASWPPYNPNDLGGEVRARRNLVIQDAIEPGSTFKPVTMAIAMADGRATPDETIDCESGYWGIGRSRVRDDHPHGVVTMTEVIKYSSNICSAKLAFRVGGERFVERVREFGFGAPTGVQLPFERAGFVRSGRDIKPIELATTAFGQGITATPLQLTMAIGAIANGGVLMSPRLVSRVEDAAGAPVRVNEPQAVRRVVPEHIADTLAQMMVTVTEPGGTGTRARVPGYTVGGKTGTAQKVEDGKYTSARIGSFVGFIPADDPVLAITVVVDEPSTGSRYGGIVAGPAFAAIAKESLQWLGVAPDPALLALEKAPAGAKSAAPSVDDLDPVEVIEPVRLVAAEGGWRLPDLHGRSLREVLVGFQDAGVSLEYSGSGVVVEQQPPPGTPVFAGDKLAVVLR